MDDFTDRVWLALVEGKQTGPLDARALADWVRRGHVTGQTYFWRRGMSEWKRGAELPELAYVFGAKVPERSPSAPPFPSPETPATSASTFGDLVPPVPVKDAEGHEPTDESSLGISGIWTASRKGGRRTIAAALIGGLTAFGVALFALTTLGAVGTRRNSETDARIARAIAETRTELQGCVDEALRQNPSLRPASFRVTAVISSSGLVRRASVDRREIEASALGECLKLRAARMVFTPLSDKDVQIEVPVSVGPRL
ncbi:MAG TPA: GYF domain-containing protein [Myxococcaceae bacterium]|nr:GYF domain-containing protein [Myxococcaceae bacterium]